MGMHVRLQLQFEVLMQFGYRSLPLPEGVRTDSTVFWWNVPLPWPGQAVFLHSELVYAVLVS